MARPLVVDVRGHQPRPPNNREESETEKDD